jgi:uncharacterized protein (TIGR02145 family)
MKQTIKIFPLAALALLAGACVVNMEDGGEPAPVAGDEECLVTLALAVPGTPASRGLDGDDENEVKAIDVLLFTTDGNDHFHYRAVGSDIVNDGVNYRKTFSVRLPEGTWNVVVLANARDAFDNAAYDYKALLAPSIPAATNVSRADVLDGLVMQLSNPANPTGKWPGGTFKGIPMWGYYNGLTIGSIPVTPTIDLTRAIARVNISLTLPARDNFALESARLYNYNRAGSLAPAVYDGTGTDVEGYDGAQWQYFATPLPARYKAIAPNVPELGLGLLVDDVSAVKVDATLAGPLVYDINNASNPRGTPVFEYPGEIYTFEAAAGSVSGKMTNTCLVIGGYYKATASPTYSTVPTYYRVEFVDGDENYLPLLRNHSYNVVIQSVTGEGDLTPWGAFNAKPVNMKAEVLEWDDEAIGDIVFDGQNYLGVGPTEFLLYGEAKAGNRFTVTTDASTGWAIVGTSSTSASHEGFDESWITITSPLSGSAGIKGSVIFSVDENNEIAERVGYIHVRAGRLNFTVKVTQRVSTGVGIWITDVGGMHDIQELVFAAAVNVLPDAQRFRLHWSPANVALDVSASTAVSGGTAFEYHASSDAPGTTMVSISDPLGDKVLTIYPAVLTTEEVDDDPFLEKSSEVEFTIVSGGTTVSSSIILRQIHFHTAVDIAANYVFDGSVHSMIVRSNTEWIIGAVDNDDGILDIENMTDFMAQSGGYNTAPGDQISFKLIDNGIMLNGEAVLTLTDPTGRMENVDVTIKSLTCGSGGVATLVQIGNNYYPTHVYGNKCWMVKDSKEGTGTGQFNWAANTDYCYYYSFAQVMEFNNACPIGWRVPTADECNELITAYNDDRNGAGKWWWNTSSNCLSGWIRYNVNPAGWYTDSDGSENHRWWYNAGGNYFLRSTSSTKDMMLYYQFGNASWYYPVRCVQE